MWFRNWTTLLHLCTSLRMRSLAMCGGRVRTSLNLTGLLRVFRIRGSSYSPSFKFSTSHLLQPRTNRDRRFSFHHCCRASSGPSASKTPNRLSASCGVSQCPLWVISGHRRELRECPLYPRKRTSVKCSRMSLCHIWRPMQAGSRCLKKSKAHSDRS